MRLSRGKAFSCLVVALLVTCASCNQHKAVSVTIDRNGPLEVKIPDRGVYTGAFIDFGDAEDEVALEMIEDFGARKLQIENASRFVETFDWSARQHEYLELVDRLTKNTLA